jgi:hypothetical protein
MESIQRIVVVGLALSLTGWAAGVACTVAGASAPGARSIPELPSAMVGAKYLAKADVPIAFGEAVAPLTYLCTIAAGAWLQVDPVTGALSGTPQLTDATGSTVTVRVRDSATPVHNYSQDYFLRVHDAARELQLISKIVEGAMVISGVATPSTKVRILDAGGVLALQSGDSAPADATSGVFTAVLAAPLYGGQTIQVEQEPSNGILVVGPAIQVPGLADWGRVRANFTAGMVLSFGNGFQNPNASQSTLFLGLNVEKNWKSAGPTSRFLFTSFFDARLTSVPVTAAAGAEAVSTIVTSAKSAELQGGAYLPILISHWNWQNAPNALFIAPIAKVGFITPTSSVPQRIVNPSQFYNFYGFGARMGHFKLSANGDSAPESLSYIDVVAGRFSNLETLAPWHTRRWRIEVEGVMKVPASPFLLGFDANIGQNLLTAPGVQGAKDDLRFFVGAKFDIGKVVAKLQQLP